MEEFHGSAGAPTGPEDRDAPAPLDAGRLGGFLCELQRKRFDGVLNLHCGEHHAALGFREGTPVTLDDPTPGHTLAEQLIERGQLTRAQGNAVLANMTDALVEDETVAFFEHAVQLGFLTDDEANVELSSRIRARMIQLFALRDCEMSLEPGTAALLGRREFPQNLGTILYMGVRTFYDEDYLTSVHPDPANTYVRLTAAPATVAHHFALDDDEFQLIRRFRPEQSLSELFQDPRVDRVHVLALVLLMRLSQLCEVSRGPFASAPKAGTRSQKLREANETNRLRPRGARESSELSSPRARTGSHVGPLPEAPGANPLRDKTGSHAGPLPERPASGALRGRTGSHVGPLPDARSRAGSYAGPLPEDPDVTPRRGKTGPHSGALTDAPRARTGSHAGPLPEAPATNPRSKTGPHGAAVTDAPRARTGSHAGPLPEAPGANSRGKTGPHGAALTDAPRARMGSHAGPLPEDPDVTPRRGKTGPHGAAVTDAPANPRARTGSHAGPLPEAPGASSRGRTGPHGAAVTDAPANPRARTGSHAGPLPEAPAGSQASTLPEPKAPAPLRGKAGAREELVSEGFEPSSLQDAALDAAERRAPGKAGSSVGPLPDPPAPRPTAKGGIDATQEALLEAAARTARMRRSVPSRRNSKLADPIPSSAANSGGREPAGAAATSGGRSPSDKPASYRQAGPAAAGSGRHAAEPQSGPANTNQQPDPRADYAKAHLKELIARRKQAANHPESSAPSARDTARELREARSLLHAQNYARAEKVLSLLVEIEPQNEVWKTYHLWARWRAQPDGSEPSLEELQELAKKLLALPEHAAFAAYVLGHIFFHAKRDDLAEKFFKRAHAADRTNKDAERHLLIIERRKQAAAEGGAGANRKLFGIQLPTSKPKP